MTARGLVIVRGRDDGGDSSQGFWMLLSQEPLGEPEVGASNCSDLAAGPGLLGNPGNCIGSVTRLIEDGGELALGGKTSPAVLQNHGIPYLNGSQSIDGCLDHHRQLLVLGQPLEEYPVRPALCGALDIGGEMDATAPGGHD